MSVDTPHWVHDAVFYQIFPDRFARSERVPKPGSLEPWDAPPTTHGFKGGDLLGIVDRLDDLVDLGITALYLNPIFSSAANHRYHTDDYEHVDPLLGGDAALRALLDACHGRAMKVILDGVFNHSGRGWLPFHHVMENGMSSPYRDWFYLDPNRLDQGRALQAYPSEELVAEMRRMASTESLASGLASERMLGYRSWWDLPALPKINVDHPPARAYLLDIAQRWLRFGADGWRLDVPAEVDQAFWREFRQRCREVDPDTYLVGEIWQVRPDWTSDGLFGALMNYPLTEALIGYCGGASIDWGLVAGQDQYRETIRMLDGPAFGSELERLMAAYDADVVRAQLNLLDSHDTPRFVTMCGGDIAAHRMATLVQMTLPGAPCVYYGDEIGMEGGLDPDCRRSFPSDPATWDNERRAFIKGAIALRKAHPVLRHGKFDVLAAVGSAMAYSRHDESDSFVIALNNGAQEASLAIDVAAVQDRPLQPVEWDGWPDGERGRAERSENGLSLHVPARGSLLLRQPPDRSPAPAFSVRLR